MPWYYAGPEAKPIGPHSLEELQGLRARGTVLSETYVIVQPALPNQPVGWRRYGEVFPATAELPPIPAATLPPRPSAHPLFPSATPAISSPGGPVFRPATPTSLHPVLYASRTNAWCAWGFGLGLAGFPCLLCFGIGTFFALAGFIFSAIGLLQLRKHPDQSGRGLALCGLLTSGATLLLALGFGIYLSYTTLKGHIQSGTESTSSDN